VKEVPNKYYSTFRKVRKEQHRPLWSVVIPTYNCAQFLRQTLQSVLLQDPGREHMEIIVVDDCSTQDDPKAVVQELAGDRIQFFQQELNVGKSKNYEFGINQSKGHFIHLLHGDDLVKEGFYKKIEQLFIDFPSAGAAFSHCLHINAQNIKIGESKKLADKPSLFKDFSKDIAVWQLIQPPCLVIKREVYETIGGYDRRLHYIEDWEYYVRCSLSYEFAYTPEPLAEYRIFAENSSSKSVKGGRRLKTLRKVLEIMDAYLPLTLLIQIKRRRNQEVAYYCLNYIPEMVANFDLKGFTVYSVEFFRRNKELRLYVRWLRFIFQYKKFYTKE
jgi:glycosyltransferase involved in cell wall biosynthesis